MSVIAALVFSLNWYAMPVEPQPWPRRVFYPEKQRGGKGKRR